MKLRPARVLTSIALLLVILFATAPLAPAAPAGGFGLPTGRAGLGLGNLPEFTGLRLNLQDSGVNSITGVNVTFWVPPAEFVRVGETGDERPAAAARNGSYRGLGLNLIGASGERLTGIHVGVIGLAAQERADGVLIGGLGFGGGNVAGLAVGGLGVGADDLTGIAVGGLGVGADDVTGIAVGGLGVGGERVRGVMLGGLGVGGEDVTGLAVGGLGVGARDVRGLVAAGGGVGARELRGLAAAAGVRTRVAHGGALGVLYQRSDRLYGVASGLYNRADHAEGLMLGLLNRAGTLRGIQIGLLNHVDSGPAAVRWLPLINARF